MSILFRPVKRARLNDILAGESQRMVTISGGYAQPRAQIDLWRSGTLCDATITVSGETFSAHRLVLAGASDFMKACLTSGMAETSTSTVDISDLRAEVFSAVLEYIYTGSCTVRMVKHNGDDFASPLDLLEAAARLQISSLMRSTSALLIAELQPHNCLLAWAHATKYEVPELRELEQGAMNFSLSHFNEIQGCAAIVMANEAQMRQLLASEGLCCPETVAFAGLVAWAMAKKLSPDDPRLVELLRLLRFPLMEQNYVASTVRTSRLMQPNQDILLDSLTCLAHRKPRCNAPTTYTITYEWVVESAVHFLTAAKGSKLRSPVFKIGDHDWHIRMSLYGEEAESPVTHVAIFIGMCERPPPGHQQSLGPFTITLHNNVENRNKSRIGAEAFTLTKGDTGRGFRTFVLLDEVNDASAGWIAPDGSIKISARVTSTLLPVQDCAAVGDAAAAPEQRPPPRLEPHDAAQAPAPAPTPASAEAAAETKPEQNSW